MTRNYVDRPRGHVWKLDGDDIDILAAGDGDRHNGPMCVNCGYGFCHHCESGPDHDCPASTPETKREFDLKNGESAVASLTEALNNARFRLAKLKESE